MLAIALVILVILLPGSAVPARAATVIVDDLGREVRVADPARRIVSLAPNLTEIAFALGLGDRLVGVTDFCDYPPAARQVARVGGVASPSAERIVALAPDLVLATTAGNGKEEVLALARLGLPVVVTDPKDLESVADSFVLIARAAGVPEAGARMAAAFRARLDAVRRAVAGRPRPRTLLVVWPDPLIAAGPGTFPSRVLEAAGALNVLAGPPRGAGGSHPASRPGTRGPVTRSAGWPAAYPTIGLESLVALAPDAIVLAAHRGATVEALARLRRYDGVPAVRDGRLAVVDQAILLRPGPRLVDAAEQLARVLHGEPAQPGEKGSRASPPGAQAARPAPGSPRLLGGPGQSRPPSQGSPPLSGGEGTAGSNAGGGR